MPFVTIDDPRDSRLDEYRNVPDPELLAHGGLFVAEGRLVVERLLTGRRFVTRSVLVTPAARSSLDTVLASRPDVPVYVVPQAMMNGITGFNVHRGCLAIGERLPAVRWQDVASGTRTIVVLERVANADNVGACSAALRHSALGLYSSIPRRPIRCTERRSAPRWAPLLSFRSRGSSPGLPRSVNCIVMDLCSWP